MEYSVGYRKESEEEIKQGFENKFNKKGVVLTAVYWGRSNDKHFYIVTFRSVSEALTALEKYNGSALFGYDNVGLRMVADYASIMELVELKKNVVFTKIGHDFRDLLETGEFSDVEIITKDKVIKAHKNILCSRSPFFKAMLVTDMKEKKTGQVRLDDENTNTDIIDNVIKFIYTGEIENMETKAGINKSEINLLALVINSCDHVIKFSCLRVVKVDCSQNNYVNPVNDRKLGR